MSSNYNLQAFTHGTLSADETHALVEYQGSWFDWDFAFVEGAGDGVLWERGTNDWKITKTSNGYKAEKTNGFTTADTFQPDSNGIVTITFSWSDHTGLKFKPPVISSGGSGTGTSGNVSIFQATFSPNTETELGFTVTRHGPTQYEGGTPHIGLYDENVYFNNSLYTTNWPTGGTITSQSASSLYNFTLDSTKTYYVASGAQGIIYATSTPESRMKKKVFCNFW